MVTMVRSVGLGILVGLVCPLSAWAQYDSELVGFNGPPIDDPETSQEMFQQPQFSGTTSAYIVANVEDYDNNAAFRAAGLQTEGDAAMYVFFEWVDATDANAWVRLTTYNGPERPNPVLDTRGKVRFKITNRSELFYGDIGVCLGIRETGGADLAQLEDGGTSGTIEWVGVDGVMTDPNDPNDVTGPIPSITLPPSSDEYELEWDLATGTVTVDGTQYTGGFAGFTGNGDLSDAPDNRGTLEHIAITNVADDSAVSIEFAIDELQFEATVPDPTPPPVICAPVVESDTEVEVECVDAASEAELYIDDSSVGTVTPVDGLATFTNLTLTAGDVLTATQTANGITSDFSSPVVVYEAGTVLADNFDGYGSQDELESLWAQDDPTNDRRVLLSSGSASSCHNYVISEYDPGSSCSRLYYDMGLVDGSDETPLLVTYRFKHSYNDTEARARFELTSSLERAYGAVGFAFTNGVGGAWGEQYTSMTNSPEPVIDGYESDYFYYDYALTGIEREPGVWHKMQIEVLSETVNFYIDDELANPVDPNSGDPIWPDGVPRTEPDESFRYIIIGVGYSNNGPAMMYDDISVTLGDTEPPFGDPHPVESPTVDGPLFPDGTLVEVSDIDPNNATDVTIYVDGEEAASVAGPFNDGTAAVTVPNLYDGQAVTATQTTAVDESCYSAPVVVAVPAPTVEQILVLGEVGVDVSDIEEGLASAVAVYEDQDGDLVLLGSVSDPTEDPVEISVPALEAGMVIVATQTIGDVEGPASDGVEVVAESPAIAAWIQTSDLPMGLTDHQLVHLDGYLYCLGGRSNTSPEATDTAYYAAVNSDGSIGEWLETATLPMPTATPGAAAYDGRVYVWGGWTTDWPTINTCWYAEQNPDGSLGDWVTSEVTIPDNVDVSPAGTQMDAMGRGDMIFNGTLYIINGEWESGDDYDNTNNCYYSTITAEGDFSSWVLTTPTETEDGSWFHGVAAIEGTTENYMYRVAGNYRGTTESDMYRSTIQSDGSLGEWVEEPLSLPAGRYEHACATADNEWLFAICGLSGSSPQSTVYYTAIDPDTGAFDEWREGPEYPETVSRNCAVTYTVGCQTYILVGGGGPYSGTAGQRTPSCYYAVITGPIPGDIDGDDDVDLSDLAALLGAYGSSTGDPDYNAGADLDCDGDVDLSDLATLLGHYGEGV